MWIFTQDGFFSIVKKDCGDDELLVRARVRGDLEAFIARTGKDNRDTFGPFEIVEVPHADYLFRVTLPYWMITEYLAVAAEGIDYDNFKDSLPANSPLSFVRRCAYMKVWGAMRDLQYDIVNRVKGLV